MTLIRSIIEYGCLVWQTVARPDLKKLENIQRKALAICLDLPWTSSREAMEVAAGVVLLDLRFSEIAIRDVAKIAAKQQDDTLKIQLNKYTEEFLDKVETPLGLAMSQVIKTKTCRDWGRVCRARTRVCRECTCEVLGETTLLDTVRFLQKQNS